MSKAAAERIDGMGFGSRFESGGTAYMVVTVDHDEVPERRDVVEVVDLDTGFVSFFGGTVMVEPEVAQ